MVKPHPKDEQHVRRAFAEDAKHPERRHALTPEQVRRLAETGERPELAAVARMKGRGNVEAPCTREAALAQGRAYAATYDAPAVVMRHSGRRNGGWQLIKAASEAACLAEYRARCGRLRHGGVALYTVDRPTGVDLYRSAWWRR